MATSAPRWRATVIFLAVWIGLLGVTAYYLYESLAYVIFDEPQPGTTWLNRRLWYFAHVVTVLPILVIAPLQFIARLRRARPSTHRALGRLFLAASILGGAFAVYLGVTIRYEGSRVPLSLFGLVWIAFSVMAWICARRGDFANHRQFVIRSLAVALAFVWIRLLYTFQNELFGFIEPGDVRDTTREWLSFVVPLLVVETWLTWWPALRRALRLRRRGQPDLASNAGRTT